MFKSISIGAGCSSLLLAGLTVGKAGDPDWNKYWKNIEEQSG